MTIQFWKDMSILVGSVELAGHGKNVNLSTAVEPLDTTALNTTGWVSLIGGNKAGTVDLVLMSDMADNGLDELAFSYFGTTDIAKSVITATADGSVAYLFRGIPLSYTPMEGAPGELAMAHVVGKSSTGPVVRGLLLHPSSVARISSSTGTARQIGAVGATQRLYAALHVLAISGSATPTLTVKVQSDALEAFGSATDQITFTAVTDVTTEDTRRQWGSVAGAVTDDWWRVSYTISGTTPSFLFAVTAGVI